MIWFIVIVFAVATALGIYFYLSADRYNYILLYGTDGCCSKAHCWNTWYIENATFYTLTDAQRFGTRFCAAFNDTVDKEFVREWYVFKRLDIKCKQYDADAQCVERVFADVCWRLGYTVRVPYFVVQDTFKSRYLVVCDGDPRQEFRVIVGELKEVK